MGIPSHVAPETPGSIHEGGELGYALSHAYGAAFDNPDLVVAWRGWIQRGIDGVLYGTAYLLTDASPPMRLRAAVAEAAPRPVLLIAGGAVMGNAEEDADLWIQAGSPNTVELWVVPDTGHTAALRTRPAQWETRVVGFLDSALQASS